MIFVVGRFGFRVECPGPVPSPLACHSSPQRGALLSTHGRAPPPGAAAAPCWPARAGSRCSGTRPPPAAGRTGTAAAAPGTACPTWRGCNTKTTAMPTTKTDVLLVAVSTLT